MAWNGIEGALNVPGMIPWYIVVTYFVVALIFVFVWGKRTGGLRNFTTTDLVYIAVGVAIAVGWQFTLGAMIEGAFSSVPFIHFAYWGEVLAIYITVGIVRKVGTGLIAMMIYDILAALFYYGFGGEPVYILYEMLTYGLFIDIMIAITGSNLFGVKTYLEESKGAVEGEPKRSRKATLLAITHGAILGFLWSLPGSFFYIGFFYPFLYGAFLGWQAVLFDFFSYLPGSIIVGALAGLAAQRIARAVSHE